MVNAVVLFMPFASIEIPSLALGLLKPLAERAGATCEAYHLHLPFRAMAPEAYDRFNLASVSQCLGQRPFEWVFSEALFGEEWAASERASVDNLLACCESGLDGGVTNGLAADPFPYERESFIEMRRAVPAFLEQCIESIPFDSCDLVGFSMSCAQVTASLALAKKVKALFPDKKVALGGYHCSGTMGTSLMKLFPFVDLVFNGEADVSFPATLERHEAQETLAGLAGVTFRQNGEPVEQGTGEWADLDSLPLPDFDDFFASWDRTVDRAEVEAEPYLMFEFSRGCDWARRSRCVFCSEDKDSPPRVKDSSVAKDGLDELSRKYGIRTMGAGDECLPVRHVHTLLSQIAEDPCFDVKFAFVRADLKRDDLRLLRSAGFTGLLAGIETLDSEILRLMSKGLNMLQVVAFLKWAREYDLSTVWFLLFGVPREPAAAYERMQGLVPLLSHLRPPHDCRPVLMFRDSPLFAGLDKDSLKPLPISRSIFPFDDSDILEISSCFDWDYRVSAAPKRSIESCLSEVSRWMDAWKKEPPLLLFQRQRGGTLKVYDTRPPGGRKVHVLDELSSAACLACDAPTSFDRLKESLDGAFPEDPVLRECLDGLIRDRLLICEGDRYLCLANDLDVMKEHCSEFGVQILGMEG